MTNPTLFKLGDLQITLSRSGRTCTLSGAELAKHIDSQAIVVRLTAVLYARSAPSLVKDCTLRPEIENTACYLADRLDDGNSLAFYRLVAEHVATEVIRNSLTRALDLPAANVRRSRAAYFTSLIRPHLQGRLPNS
jgi:hypothetical protein